MLTREEMQKILQAVKAGKMRPTGLPLNRAKLDELAKKYPAKLPPLATPGLQKSSRSQNERTSRDPASRCA